MESIQQDPISGNYISWTTLLIFFMFYVVSTFQQGGVGMGVEGGREDNNKGVCGIVSLHVRER